MDESKPYDNEELVKAWVARFLLEPPGAEVVGRMMATINVRDIEIVRLNKKWSDYEFDYILPMFKVAKERGFDLQQAVMDNPGRNAGELFFEYFFHINTSTKKKG